MKTMTDEFMLWWEKTGCLTRSGGGDYERTFAFEAWRTQATRITELEAQLADAKKDAERYLKLRRMAVELSLSHQVISQFVTNQGELDAAIAEGKQA